MGEAYLAAGDLAEAEHSFNETLDLQRAHRTGLQMETLTLAGLAHVHLRKGKAELARTPAEEAVTLAQERGQRFSEIGAQIQLAEALCAEQGSRARGAAERALQRAAELVEATGGRAYQPRIPEARARLAEVCGDTAARDRFLHEAQRLYVEIGATGHTARLEKGLRL